MVSDLLAEFHCGDGAHSLIFDDDGRTGYAYLLRNGNHVGDVWLYNRCVTPIEPEWVQRPRVPFANCAAFVSDDPFDPPKSMAAVSVEWIDTEDTEALMVMVFIHGRLHATIRAGEKPGRCRLARRDGPLAKILSAEDHNAVKRS